MKIFVSLFFLIACLNSYAHAGTDTEMVSAIEGDNVPKVRHLIEAGTFDLDGKISGNPLVVIAARSASLGVLHYLIQAKADLNATNPRSETAPMMAAYFDDDLDGFGLRYARHERALGMLIDAGAKLENAPGGNTALAFAAHANHPRMVRALLAAGANPNGTAKYGVSNENTPLIMATLSGAVESVRILLQNGADPLVINSYGNDALFYAERDNHKEIAKILQCALALRPSEKFEHACK